MANMYVVEYNVDENEALNRECIVYGIDALDSDGNSPDVRSIRHRNFERSCFERFEDVKNCILRYELRSDELLFGSSLTDDEICDLRLCVQSEKDESLLFDNESDELDQLYPAPHDFDEDFRF